MPGDVSVLEKPQIRPRHPSSVASSLTGGRRGISYTEEPQGGQGHLEGFCASLVMLPSATATTLALGTSGPPSILTPFSPLHFSDLHSISPDLWLPSVVAHSITPRSGIRISICLVQSHPGCCSHSCQQPVLSSYTPSPTCKVNAPNFY